MEMRLLPVSVRMAGTKTQCMTSVDNVIQHVSNVWDHDQMTASSVTRMDLLQLKLLQSVYATKDTIYRQQLENA